MRSPEAPERPAAVDANACRPGWFAVRDERRRVADDPKRRERDAQLRSLDERIGEGVSQALASGELQRSGAWSLPLPDDGYFDTPPELRLAFKALRNAGHVPAEVEMLQEVQRWREQLARLDAASDAAKALRARIAERQLVVQLRIERLARTLSLRHGAPTAGASLRAPCGHMSAPGWESRCSVRTPRA